MTATVINGDDDKNGDDDGSGELVTVKIENMMMTVILMMTKE